MKHKNTKESSKTPMSFTSPEFWNWEFDAFNIKDREYKNLLGSFVEKDFNFIEINSVMDAMHNLEGMYKFSTNTQPIEKEKHVAPLSAVSVFSSYQNSLENRLLAYGVIIRKWVSPIRQALPVEPSPRNYLIRYDLSKIKPDKEKSCNCIVWLLQFIELLKITTETKESIPRNVLFGLGMRFGIIQERISALEYDKYARTGMIRQKPSSTGGKHSKGRGRVQKDQDNIKEFMIEDLADRMKDGKGKLPFDAHRRVREATLKEFNGKVSKDRLKRSPFKLEDLMPEVKKRYKNMK